MDCATNGVSDGRTTQAQQSIAPMSFMVTLSVNLTLVAVLSQQTNIEPTIATHRQALVQAVFLLIMFNLADVTAY